LSGGSLHDRRVQIATDGRERIHRQPAERGDHAQEQVPRLAVEHRAEREVEERPRRAARQPGGSGIARARRHAVGTNRERDDLGTNERARCVYEDGRVRDAKPFRRDHRPEVHLVADDDVRAPRRGQLERSSGGRVCEPTRIGVAKHVVLVRHVDGANGAMAAPRPASPPR
jgi:hypothetical protein